MPRMATCHPEKRLVARGLCRACYTRKHRDNSIHEHDLSRKPRQPATCHPHLWAHGHGLCKRCWANKRETEFGDKARWLKANPEKRKAVARDYYEKNKERILAKHAQQYIDRPWRNRGFTYQATEAEFEQMFAAQGEQCASCKLDLKFGADVPRMSRPHVDHDHDTGRVRGILCGWCNVTLGQCQESIERLEACVAYLRTHHAMRSEVAA